MIVRNPLVIYNGCLLSQCEFGYVESLQGWLPMRFRSGEELLTRVELPSQAN